MWCGARSSVAAGRLALATKPIGTAQAAERVVSYRVERLDASLPEVIATSRPAPVLVLPAGRYRVEGRYGAMNARTVRDIEVKAGQTQQLTLEPQAAALKLRLVEQRPAPRWGRLLGHPGRSGRHGVDNGPAEPSAALQAGRYKVRRRRATSATSAPSSCGRANRRFSS